jgi:hypothetical protein
VILRVTKILLTDGTETTQHPALSVGAKYLVLGFLLGSSRRLVRVRDGYGTPSMWPIEAFEVASDTIPSNWCGSISAVDGETYLSIGPRPFMRPGFWDDYFSDDRTAIDVYEQEVARMISSENPSES